VLLIKQGNELTEAHGILKMQFVTMVIRALNSQVVNLKDVVLMRERLYKLWLI
jgi:hypothetical protein